MKLATLPNDRPDGKLIVASSDAARFLSGDSVAPTLQAARSLVEAELRALAAKLDNGDGELLHNRALAAPLSRAWQCWMAPPLVHTGGL